MSNVPVKIYFKPTCPYCVKAFKLLETKNLTNLEKIDITEYPELKEQMIAESNGRTTVPQIFINNEHIGGCDDLYLLESSQLLDQKLS